MTTTSSVLEMIAETEQAARAQAEYLRTQIEQLTGQLNELEGHLADLATTRQVIVSLSHGEPTLPEPPDLPGNPAYQHIPPPSPTRPPPYAQKTYANASTSAWSRRTSRGCARSSNAS